MAGKAVLRRRRHPCRKRTEDDVEERPWAGEVVAELTRLNSDAGDQGGPRASGSSRSNRPLAERAPTITSSAYSRSTCPMPRSRRDVQAGPPDDDPWSPTVGLLLLYLVLAAISASVDPPAAVGTAADNARPCRLRRN